MSLMTYNKLLDVMNNGWLEGVDPDLINAASIDVRLGKSMLIEEQKRVTGSGLVDLAKKETPAMKPLTITADDYLLLHPGQFVLAETIETFHLPNNIACEFKLKSSAARAGLNHSLAGWGDPGFNNATLTLELHNALQYHTLTLHPGMRIGQIVFWEGESVPNEHSYATKGRYNNQRGATESKGL